MTSTTTRRTLLTAAAAVPAIAVLPATATTPDPIFAVIEAHSRAWSNLGRCSELDAAASHGDKEAEQELARLNAALDDAKGKLLDIPPATIAGVAAALTYAADYVTRSGCSSYGEVWGYNWPMTLHRNLAKALRAITVQS